MILKEVTELGIVDGLLVGAVEGLVVGELLGFVVGELVGAEDGLVDGRKVGYTVGLTVGCVGAMVGMRLSWQWYIESVQLYLATSTKRVKSTSSQVTGAKGKTSSNSPSV